MEKIVVACVLFLTSAGLFLLGVRSFQEKGFLFNNAYIYATKQERERMNKTPHYRQTANVFLLLGIGFLLSGTALLSGMDWLYWLAGIVEAATIVYAVVSCIVIEKRRM